MDATYLDFLYRYIGHDKAIADLPGSVKIGGFLTFVFWRSVYASGYILHFTSQSSSKQNVNVCLFRLLSWKNRTLVVTDWLKTHIWGRDTGRE